MNNQRSINQVDEENIRLSEEPDFNQMYPPVLRTSTIVSRRCIDSFSNKKSAKSIEKTR